ncbi:hypothetical protein RQP46_003643 [Phenoliferia psychrophenolica]
MDEQTQDTQSLPVAPSPPTSTPASPVTESSTPALPTEVVADIIDLTVEMLIDEERDLPSQIPVTNHFLRAAALVNRTWRSIAAPALLKNGLVTPPKVDQFLAQIKKHQMERTLDSVRFGVGGAVLDDARDESADDAKFDALVESLPGLKKLEIVGGGLVFESGGDILPCPTAFDELVFSNSNLSLYEMAYKFFDNAPAALTIYESGPHGVDKTSRTADRHATDFFASFAYKIPKISITSNQLIAFYYLGCIVALSGASPLGSSYHFDCNSPTFLVDLKSFVHNFEFSKEDLPSATVSHIAAHIEMLHFLATGGPYRRPNLTSLEVLAHLKDTTEGIELEEAEIILLELVDLPVLAKLKVPAYWKSEAVEDACEAKGIDLRWT